MYPAETYNQDMNITNHGNADIDVVLTLLVLLEHADSPVLDGE